MLKVECDLIGISPISFSRAVQSVQNTGEAHDAFEQRIWRERAHRDAKGEAYISPMALKNCLSEVAKYLSESVPGKGKATYTKHFEAGILVTDAMMLGMQADEIPGERLYVPSNGRRGSGTRVWKTFPTLTEWRVHAVIYVLDPVLIDKPKKILEYLEHAGKFIGMGRFRPRNNGFYGRFRVENFKHSKVLEEAA